MSLRVLLVTPTSATLEIEGAGAWRSARARVATIDGRVAWQGYQNVFTVRGLEPGGRYLLQLRGEGGEPLEQSFTTRAERARIDVRDCDARGDGRHDDTAALQAAIAACPPGGTVAIPEGNWLSAPLFLKSDLHVEFARGARLVGHPDIARWPVIPGIVRGASGEPDLYLGSWEGTPEDCHAALLTGVGVSGVTLHGEGEVDGNASFETWWSRPKARFAGWRPRLVHFMHSRDIAIEGLTLRNSPSWTVHPYACRGVTVVNARVTAPEDSPNTDGVNPESCEDVTIAGVHFSTGDDCIALKSGKAWVAERDPRPTRNVRISNCLMEKGHGAVVIGSEMSGGVTDVDIRDCVFEGTDRGLRVKTRRGRGQHAIVDRISMRGVRMRGVGVPFVVNAFYWCDPDGKSLEVGDRHARPVDTGTPTLGRFELTDIVSEGTRFSAGFVLGLPERPIQSITLDRYTVHFDADAVPGEPDMAEGIVPVARQGFLVQNVASLVCTDVSLDGAEGPAWLGEGAR